MSVRVVYDTMLFLQAALRPERTHATFRLVQHRRVELCLSRELLAEVSDVRNRDRLRAKFPAFSPDGVKAFLAAVVSQSTLFDPVPNVFTWPEHPDDDHLFNLAIYSESNFVVAWETRLLNLKTDPSASSSLRQFTPNLDIVAPPQLIRLIAEVERS